MFSTSTQKKYWTFSTEDPEILTKIRHAAYTEYLHHFGPIIGQDRNNTQFFLTFDEERLLIDAYEEKMSTFCKHFHPPLPLNVIGSAFHYYKRFWLGNSAMNYHPKDIYPTCVYLACKIEEYNLSISEFIQNFEESSRPHMERIIIDFELLIICSIKFHLTIFNPYRPVRGFLSDLERKQPAALGGLSSESLLPIIHEYLDKIWGTDIIFYYSPSQIALASMIISLQKKKINIDAYVQKCLVAPDQLGVVIGAVKSIRSIIKKFNRTINKSEIIAIEKKLMACRNPENDPGNIEHYKPPMREEEEDEAENSFLN